jgi:diaminopimelate epimerase
MGINVNRTISLTFAIGSALAAVAGALTGKTGRRVEVEGPYGTLCVEWSQQDNHVYATGPAEPVFSGIWNE